VMELPLATWILLVLVALSVAVGCFQLVCLILLRRKTLPEPPRYPSFSVLKPLCGLDDELLENLRSHVEIDYPGDYEVILGVRTESDLAYPVAQAFAAQYPDRVRVVLQQGEPGHNPKVNQLITLTREAKYELLALTDSNVRVPRTFLNEHASVLSDPKIGVSSHAFIGVGEQRLGAVLDNLTIASFCAPMMGTAAVAMKVDQIVGKSIAIKREVLAEVGGWHEVKDVLAEDQRLGVALNKMGMRTGMCPTPVLNVQRSQPFGHFWGRHTRWSMIRFRVLMPAVLAEPLANTFLLGLIAGMTSFRAEIWAVTAFTAAFSMFFTHSSAKIVRGYGFKPWQVLLVPLRDVLFFLSWLRGSTLRSVVWRGNKLRVLAKTRMVDPETLQRAKKIQKISRDASEKSGA
jgi:ceramide glucosyltransferase